VASLKLFLRISIPNSSTLATILTPLSPSSCCSPSHRPRYVRTALVVLEAAGTVAREHPTSAAAAHPNDGPCPSSCSTQQFGMLPPRHTAANVRTWCESCRAVRDTGAHQCVRRLCSDSSDMPPSGIKSGAFLCTGGMDTFV
ncbi:hypothetical protein B0H19DRAFT_1172280, partial [Mycena capillaripes]